MSIFDQTNFAAGPGVGGPRAEAEEYAVSLGLTPGTPQWGAAIRDFVMNVASRPSPGARPPMQSGMPGPGVPMLAEARAGGLLDGPPPGALSPLAMAAAGGSRPGLSMPAAAELPGPGGGDPFAAAERPPAERIRPVRGLLAAADQEGGPVYRRGPMGSGAPAQRPAPTPRPAEPAAEPTPRQTVMRRIRRAESTNDSERNRAGSNATGRYQFMPDTFVGYYRQAFPNSRETRAQILRHITDGEIQDRLMNLYMDDSEQVLADAERELTPGNLYFVHVAGHPAAQRVLDAPDRPITDYFSDDAIRQNGWNRNWTGGDVIDWANRRMAPPPPPRRRRPRP